MAFFLSGNAWQMSFGRAGCRNKIGLDCLILVDASIVNVPILMFTCDDTSATSHWDDDEPLAKLRCEQGRLDSMASAHKFESDLEVKRTKSSHSRM